MSACYTIKDIDYIYTHMHKETPEKIAVALGWDVRRVILYEGKMGMQLSRKLSDEEKKIIATYKNLGDLRMFLLPERTLSQIQEEVV